MTKRWLALPLLLAVCFSLTFPVFAVDRSDKHSCPTEIGSGIGSTSFASAQKELSVTLKERIAKFLPAAIASKRTLGIEIEFGGLNSQKALDEMALILGGTLHGGMIQLRADANIEIVKREFELERRGDLSHLSIATDGNTFELSSTAKSGRLKFATKIVRSQAELETFLRAVARRRLKLKDFTMSLVELKAQGVDDKDYIFTWENWGVLRTPGSNWIEGVWSLDKAIERISAWRGNDVATKPGTVVRNSRLGDVDLHSEPVGSGMAGIEMVTPPVTHDKLIEVERFQIAIGKLGAKGVESGYSSGVHVNVGVQHDPPEKHAKMVRRMILRWSKIRRDVVARFEPSSLRVCTVDNNRPFYGDYSPAFLKDLNELGEDGATKENILGLYDEHYPDMEAVYRGKWFDVNPLPLLWGKGDRIEVRLFNSEFRPGQEKYIRDATELVLSMVEQAASEPLP